MEPSYARATSAGLALRVRVVPSARSGGIVGLLGDRVKVRLAEPPERGRANAALEALLGTQLGVEGVRVIAGHHRPEKIVLLPDVHALDAHQRRVLETGTDR